MTPRPPADGEYLRPRLRPARVVALACFGALLAFLAPGSAVSAGASFNAGIVWAEATEGVYAANVDGSGVRELVPSIADGHYDPAWSPSADRLVFSTRNSDSVELLMLRPAAGTRRALRLRGRWRWPRHGRNFSYVLESTWAPDEQHLAVSDFRNPVDSSIRIVSLRAGPAPPTPDEPRRPPGRLVAGVVAGRQDDRVRASAGDAERPLRAGCDLPRRPGPKRPSEARTRHLAVVVAGRAAPRLCQGGRDLPDRGRRRREDAHRGWPARPRLRPAASLVAGRAQDPLRHESRGHLDHGRRRR